MVLAMNNESSNDGSQNQLSRRTFVASSVGIALMFGLGAVAKAAPRQALLRPPGGQDEKAFLSKCIKCDRCRSVCHTSAIGIVPIEEGFLQARTPMMKFHIGSCDFCNKCIDVCPTGALELFDKHRDKVGMAYLTDVCIALNFGACTLCYSACPYKAITLDEHKRPLINEEKCNGCGVCENICPALIMRSYVGGKVRGVEIRPISPKEA